MRSPIRSTRAAGAAVLCGLLASALACSVNPATGNRQLALIGEQQEIAMGRQYHQQVLATMPVYDDERAQAYVSRLGQRLAAESERPHLPWTFTLLDDPAINAFALPGGFIYLTRGIMTHFTSEAELTAVLGHELGHVTARHSVNQLSKSQLLNLGLGLGMILSPEFAQFGDLAQLGGGLLMLKFGRDDERQADELGLRYLVAAGYQPSEMPKVFDMLARVGEAQSGGQRLPNWLSTHPQPEDRSQRIASEVARMEPLPDDLEVGRAELLGVIDGMVFGADPRQGYFRGDRFYHPELAFQIGFPSDWTHSNQPQRVVSVSEKRDALVQLSLSGAESAAAAARAFAAEENVEEIDTDRIEVNDLSGMGVAFRSGSGESEILGTAVFLDYGERVYELVGLSRGSVWSSRRREIADSLDSFDRLTDRRYLDVEPARVDIVEVRSDLTLEAFAERYPSSVPTSTLVLINQLAGDELAGGLAYKRVVGGELPE